jgi:hypothetical protein
MSVDPLADEYPNISSYAYVANDPINMIDPDGRFILPARLVSRYPAFAKYLQNNIGEIMNSDAIMGSLKQNGGLSRSTVANDIQFGKGPRIDIRKLGGENFVASGYFDGVQKDGVSQIALDSDMLDKFESIFANDKVSGDVKQAALMGVVSTLLHEYTHHGTGGSAYESEEMGHKFEIDAYGAMLQPDDINQLMQVKILKETGNRVYHSNHREIIEVVPLEVDRSVIPTLPKID